MGTVIDCVNRPAMLIGKIDDAGERRILETKTHTRWVNMRGNANNCVHQLVKKSTMRDDQITAWRTSHEIVQRLTRAQE